jgi:hypothetical protein
MGGNALKHAKTERKNKIDYLVIKNFIIEQLSKYVTCTAIIEAPEKENFGDLDILYVHNDSYEINSLINEIFNPIEIVNNGPITSFDYDNFQIDLMKAMTTTEFNSKMFYFSYGDLGCLMGKMINFYKIKFGDRGLWINITNNIDNKFLDVKCNIGKELILTNEPSEICNFFDLDYLKWQCGFNTKNEIYEWLASSKYFIKGIFNIENGADRKRMENRKMYIDFMKWLWGDSLICTESKPIIRHIQYEAIIYFNKKNKLEEFISQAKILENRKEKYNGKFFIKKGIKSTLIVQTMADFEKYIEKIYEIEFVKWLDSTNKDIIETHIDIFFSDKK